MVDNLLAFVLCMVLLALCFMGYIVVHGNC